MIRKCAIYRLKLSPIYLSFFQLYNTEDLKLEIFKRLLQMSYDFKYTWQFVFFCICMFQEL